MTITIVASYGIDTTGERPWQHDDSLDEKILQLFEGQGMEWVGSDFEFDDSVRTHTFEFDLE